MIQAMTTMRSGVAEQGQPAPLANALAAAGEAGAEGLPGFDLHMLQADEPVAAELAELLMQLPHTPAEPVAVGPAALAGDSAQGSEQVPALTAESAAEQWLLGILDQQALQVRARSAEAEPTPLAVQAVLAADERDALRYAEPLRAMPQPTENELPMPAERFAAAPDMPREANPRGAAATVASAEPRPASMPPASDPAVSAAPLAVSAAVEPLAPAQGGEQPLLAVERGQGTSPAANLERTLSLPANQARWGEQMLQALREHVELQVQHKVQSATIRLDPPELGALEILVSHESGRLTVQVSAAQADVARLLQQTSDRLRQELVGQQFVHVSVQVGADGQKGQQPPREDAPPTRLDQIAAAGQGPADASAEQAARGSRDVLVTV